MKGSGAPAPRAVDIKNLIMDNLKFCITQMTGTTRGGTFTTTPEKCFDKDLVINNTPNAVDQYAECLFGSICKLIDFRVYFSSGNTNTNGRWKIEYRDLVGVWHDLKTGIPSGILDAWSSWEIFASNPETDGIRFTCTTYDANSSRIKEIQIRGVKCE
ncbi:unnamed protein product [marine sediment metagenome]|uniref:Uncharacterized protein n=1 Tax=marine sediment metagenome TaxID=412755 RepID=X1MT59_9ZZZZ